VSRRDKDLVVLREEIEEDIVEPNIRDDGSTSGREVKSFTLSMYRQLVYLTTNGVQQFINNHYHSSRYLTVTTYRGHQFVMTNTSLNGHSTALMSRPDG
jgi:hypothetical protein